MRGERTTRVCVHRRGFSKDRRWAFGGAVLSVLSAVTWEVLLQALYSDLRAHAHTHTHTHHLCRTPLTFSSLQAIEAMSRVLFALCGRAPPLAYTRQLCHMVAFVMVVFGGPSKEEAVFWTLAGLQAKLFGHCGGQWPRGVAVEQGVLGLLAARKAPKLAAHLLAQRTELASITAPWLNSLFVSALPPETTARVWDCIVCEGAKMPLRVGLALLKVRGR